MWLLYPRKITSLSDNVIEEEEKDDVEDIVEVQLQDPIDTKGFFLVSNTEEELDQDNKNQSIKQESLLCKGYVLSASSSNDLYSHVVKVHGIKIILAINVEKSFPKDSCNGVQKAHVWEMSLLIS